MRWSGGLAALGLIVAVVLVSTYFDFLEHTKTHYSVLGVTPTATTSEIRSAYRKMSLKYHPDKQAGRSPSDGVDTSDVNSQFYEIVEAYETLSDDQSRSRYDRELREKTRKNEEMRNDFRRTWQHPGQRSNPGRSFTLSWHLRHLLPMAHPSLRSWWYHILSFIRFGLRRFHCIGCRGARGLRTLTLLC